MNDNNLYIREVELPEEGTDDIRRMIRVVPSALWITVIGGILIVAAFLIWSFFGKMSIAQTVLGFYHPGAAEQGEVLCYVPLETGKTFDTGMNVTLYPEGLSQQEYGHLKGKITYVDSYVTDPEELKDLVESQPVANSMLSGGAGVLVYVELLKDEDSANGYYWSNKRGSSYNLSDGTYMSVSVETDVMRPLDYMLPDFGE